MSTPRGWGGYIGPQTPVFNTSNTRWCYPCHHERLDRRGNQHADCLWPVASAAQIARRLHRPTGAISGKASRLRKEGVLPAGGVAKQHNVTPWPTRSPLMQTSVENAPAKTAGDARAMQPCSWPNSRRQCHWPLDLGARLRRCFAAVPSARPALLRAPLAVTRRHRRDRCYRRRHADTTRTPKPVAHRTITRPSPSPRRSRRCWPTIQPSICSKLKCYSARLPRPGVPGRRR